MRIFLLIYLISLVLLPAKYVFAEKTPQDMKNQVQTLIAETRSSQDWVYIATTDQGFVGFLSKDRFLIKGDNRTAWTKVFIENGMKVETASGKENTMIYSLTHTIYDCLESKTSVIKTVRYYLDGSSDSRDYASFYKVYPDERWTEITPGTLGDIPLKFVCSYNAS